jgi:hypothetical protein
MTDFICIAQQELLSRMQERKDAIEGKAWLEDLYYSNWYGQLIPSGIWLSAPVALAEATAPSNNESASDQVCEKPSQCMCNGR